MKVSLSLEEFIEQQRKAAKNTNEMVDALGQCLFDLIHAVATTSPDAATEFAGRAAVRLNGEIKSELRAQFFHTARRVALGEIHPSQVSMLQSAAQKS